jgi:uncharacterized membrane protein YbhN (UPF0104 family)
MSADTLESPPANDASKRGGWARPTTVLSVAVSVALLVALYRTVRISLVVDALLKADKAWLLVSVGMIIPITVLRALRFYWVAPARALMGVGEALRLTLVASALNVFLPAKTGDLVKSYFVSTRGHTPAAVAVAIVVYERLCDLFGLIAWCLLGWLVGRPQMPGLGATFWAVLGGVGAVCAVLILSERAAVLVQTTTARMLPHRRLRKLHELAGGWCGLLRLLGGRRRWIVSYSLVLWLTHLFQLWLFTVALSMRIPFTVSASLSAVALMVGQLPFTFAGLGARDVALVVLLAGYTTPELAAAMGVLMSTRGLLPPLMGLPIMRPYLSSAVEDARVWWQKVAHVPG